MVAKIGADEEVESWRRAADGEQVRDLPTLPPTPPPAPLPLHHLR